MCLKSWTCGCYAQPKTTEQKQNKSQEIKSFSINLRFSAVWECIRTRTTEILVTIIKVHGIWLQSKRQVQAKNRTTDRLWRGFECTWRNWAVWRDLCPRKSSRNDVNPMLHTFVSFGHRRPFAEAILVDGLCRAKTVPFCATCCEVEDEKAKCRNSAHSRRPHTQLPFATLFGMRDKPPYY